MIRLGQDGGLIPTYLSFGSDLSLQSEAHKQNGLAMPFKYFKQKSVLTCLSLKKIHCHHMGAYRFSAPACHANQHKKTKDHT